MQILKEEIRNNILTAALSEFEQYGYAQSSMRRIASMAGMTTGNIYRYFKNKDDLFQALMGPAHEQFISYTIAIKEEIDKTFTIHSDEVFEYIKMVDETIVEMLKDSSVEIKILLTLSEGSAYASAKQDLISIVTQILEKVLMVSRETSNLDPQDRLSMQMLSVTIIEGMCLILRDYRDGATIKYLVDELLQVFSVGIAEKMGR
ncbi:TetR/AcrR family transcriptional regulator [Paenibacillus sp. Marseille-Q4541]|uniref:TetR/AcrR family transcriptional regulator n=1 Tax=Paenibacillus sp. Marseille-Q4541 TaxID=2831522 RepID=UPI001BAAFF54|nr:TetR/AcrR family transcriptional regulator [Paenibacillus sp. Marseille-Q4541]